MARPSGGVTAIVRHGMCSGTRASRATATDSVVRIVRDRGSGPSRDLVGMIDIERSSRGRILHFFPSRR